ncbi:MAG: vanadium-dependent haloperoxidase [Verrucomicrobiales bacterium]|nr:vanadium-dependent haloperoxidase [Verrucomicrobiales bacterium]
MNSFLFRHSPPAFVAVGVLSVLAATVPPVHAQQSAARQWNLQLLDAIRRNVPNPPAHARNLFHAAAAMYSAWSAYSPTSVGYAFNEKVVPLPADVELARHEAVSYAAYRVLRARFASGAGAATSLASFDTQLTSMGYSTVTGQGPITPGSTPAEVGKRAGQAILNWGAADNFSNLTYPQPYDATVNPNMSLSMSVLGDNASFETDKPLGFGVPDGTDPNLWQPLALASQVTQNGIPIPGGTQTFVGVQGLIATPFSLTRTDPLKPWIDPFGGPSKLSIPGNPSPSDAAYRNGAFALVKASSELNDPTPKNISPGAMGNNPLGADTGTGNATNPVTGLPYAPNLVKTGDYYRVLAEFWADGPNSETPPGHWHVLANEMADKPGFVKKIGGTGPVVNNLEWDVKTYFALAGAVHDASCAAWALKRYYSGTRPITMIRYLGSLGQSSDPGQPSYHPQGLPLQAGVVEVITEASTAPGQRHETLLDLNTGQIMPGSGYLGQIAVYSWPGEHPDNLPAPSVATHQSMVRWMLAKDWLPFQRKTFNTPAFPGYISGHSCFSRSAAEVLTKITGSPYWPGGFHDHLVAANSLQIDKGPSTNVVLQWCTYYDCADQAGQSRRWGGIHVSEDDYHGRFVGSQAGLAAYALASKYWTGEILTEPFHLTPVYQGSEVILTWHNVRGMYHQVQWSTDLGSWTNVGPAILSYDTNGTWTDTTPSPGRKYYRVKRSTDPGGGGS